LYISLVFIFVLVLVHI